MRKFLALLPLLIGVGTAPAVADVSILVDEVHGLPTAAELSALLPQCDITPLTAADFPLTDVLADGIITEMSFQIVFDVPPATEALYGRFVYDGAEMQLPLVILHGPDGSALAEQCNGSLHLEDPVPGQYTLVYETWYEELTTTYEIGIGPYLLSAEILTDYDLVFSLWDDTLMLFIGTVPPYSLREETVLTDYIAGGGGYLYVREPLTAIAMKPIVNLYANSSVHCDVALSFPGALSFAEPPCTTTPETGGTLCRWEDVTIAAGEQAQILYEGKLAEQTSWLHVTAAADHIEVGNRTPQPLAEINLLRREGPDDWRLLQIDTLAPATVFSEAAPERLDRLTLVNRLETQLRQGGHEAGLYDAEIEEFIARYRWVERWLAEAETCHDWCAVYRISADAYEDFIPRHEQLQPQQAVRTMWVWATGLGAAPAAAQSARGMPLLPPAPTTPLHRELDTGQPQLIYHEYGVLWQRGSGASSGDGDRTPGFLNWSFHDEASLFDPVHNYQMDPQCILFSRPGGHPDALTIMTGAPEMAGWVSGAVAAPWTEQLLTGSEYCHTADDVFPPGSYPPVAVATSLGAGRVAAIADRDFLAPIPYNPEFVANLVTWLAQETTAAPNLPAASARIVSVVPNPFNPRTTVTFRTDRRGPLQIGVHDLTGRRVAELAAGVYDAGTHTVMWDGCDLAAQPLPSGVYLLRLTAAEANESRKLMLVR